MGEGDIGSGVVPIGPLYSTADPLGAPVTPNCHPNVLPITNTSPAYNTGTNGDIPPGITTDERGSARISAGTVDIGAYELFVNNDPAIIAAVGDPIVCNGPGGFVTVTATVTNPNNTQQPASFTANLDAGLTAMPGTCNASVNPSSCVIVAGGGSVTWAGNLNAGATVTLTYQAQVAANTLIGASLCAKSVANVGGAMKDVTACVSVNCPPSGFVPRTNVPASSQRAGSLLAFPYYTSKVAEQKDTRLTVSNIGERRAWVHLFFVDGTSCQQADQFLCLTPNASFSFKTSEYDPEATGFALAVAVDAQGNPVQNNVLIGNAFVRDGAYVDNYSAETFWRYDNGPNIGGRGFAVLALNGTQYDAAPIQFTAEIQSPQDTTGQKIVLAPLSGDLSGIANLSSALPTFSTAAAQVGSGIAANEEEKTVSFNALLSGGCLKSAVLSATFPRVPSGLGLLIPSGKAGSLTFRVGAGVGLLMTPRTGNNKWSGIRALHKNAIGNAALAIPVLVPVC
ncbi:MAG: choice-of-anchor Q domain-containing protein [Blastocatellia bacterium]